MGAARIGAGIGGVVIGLGLACSESNSGGLCGEPLSEWQSTDGCNTCQECRADDWFCSLEACALVFAPDGGCLAFPCLADTDTLAEDVQPQCVVEATGEGGVDQVIPECAGPPGEPELSVGDHVCFHYADPVEVSQSCADEGFPVALKFLFAEPPDPDWEANAQCETLDWFDWQDGATCHGPGPEEL